jgi:hypothetical protein
VEVVDVVVDDVVVVDACVVVVATDGGPNVHPAITTSVNAIEINLSRRANTRSSCPVDTLRTSHPREWPRVSPGPLRVRCRQDCDRTQ